MKCRLLLLPLFLLLNCRPLMAQEASAGISGHYGSFITKMSKSDVLKDSYSSLIALEWSRNSALASRTRLGFLLLHGNTGGRALIGKVTAAMATADQPLGNGWYRAHLRLGIGLGYITKPYDPETNHKNTLLGSHLNAAIQASVYQEIRIGSHWSWNSGISFLHLSNGTSSLPNLGLNIPALFTGINYRWKTTPMGHAVRDTSAGRNGFQLWASAGLKQWPLVNSPRTVTEVFSLEWAHRISTNGRWGAELQLFHDPSSLSPSDTVLQAPGGGGWELGAGLHYTVVLGRLELPLQAGAYIINRRDANSVYQSLGVRYRFRKRWLAGIHLKTHMGKADYIHAGIGYQWK